MIKDITCICCPIGCIIHTEKIDEKINVSGNNCKRGENYAKEELVSPKRIITSTVKVIDGNKILVPVKTTAPIDKDKIFTCMEIIHNIKAKAPISIGDIIIKDIAEGIDLVSCSFVSKRNNEKENF